MLLTELSVRIASKQHPQLQPRRSLVVKRARNKRAFFWQNFGCLVQK